MKTSETDKVDEQELAQVMHGHEADAEEPAPEKPDPADEADRDDTEEESQRIAQILRMTEALLFASREPADVKTLSARLPKGADVKTALADLQRLYKNRGVNLVCIGGKWGFRTAPDLSYLMEEEREETRRLSKAAIETLAIIAYHQPVTRAEIEDIRGVAVSKGTLDLLMEAGWVRPRGRRRVPGRPLTYGTNDAFLEHFGLESVQALPGLEDLKAAGLLEARLPPDFDVPDPSRADTEDDLDPIDDETDDLSDTLFAGEEEDEDGESGDIVAEPGDGGGRQIKAAGEVGAVANDNLEDRPVEAGTRSADTPLRKPVPLRG